MKRLLVVKIADIGDLLLATPALEALRDSFPGAQIDVLTTRHAAPILDHTGLVDSIITYNVAAFERLRDLLKPTALRESLRLAWRLRRARYDAVLIFHQLSTRFGALKQAAIALSAGAPRCVGLDNGRGWFLTDRVCDVGFGARHQADYWLATAALLGARPENRRLHAGCSPADRVWAREKLPDGPIYAAVHPGSGRLNVARRWDPEKLAAVADALHERHNVEIVILGGPHDGAEAMLAHMQHRPIMLAGETTLGRLVAVLTRCNLYVGSDSGVTHLAAAVPGLRIVSLFGPTNHEAWRPRAAEALVIRSGVLCSPCGYVEHSVGLRGGCEARTCMRLIAVDDVLERASALLSQRQDEHTPSRSQPEHNVAQGLSDADTRLRILGIPINALTFAGLLECITDWMMTPQPRARMICTANPELIMIAQRDSLFFNILRRCDLVTADGVGLLWAARWLRRPLPERVTGSDGLPLIAELAASRGWRVFLLGAAPGVAEKAAQILQGRYPGLRVAGTFAGSPSAADEDEITALVNASHADILFVAYGSPAQEKWIARNLPRLRVRVVIGVGGAFDFVAGVTQRAPAWMQRAGIEWLHRLIRQPWRWRRMLRLPRFVWAVLRRGERGPITFVGAKKRVS